METKGIYRRFSERTVLRFLQQNELRGGRTYLAAAHGSMGVPPTAKHGRTPGS
ncbi:MAG: hypothetical protein ACO20P_03925 [bacterium]